MLMSTIAAPMSTAMPAARARASGSRPKIWTAKRRPSKLGHIRPTALAAPRVSASAERNSVKVSAAPSSSQIVRNGRSVTASIGARSAPGLSSMSPMRMRARENSIALAGIVVVASDPASADRVPPSAAPRRRRPPAGAHGSRSAARPTWSIPGAGPRTNRRQTSGTRAAHHAIEDIGPFERARPGDPTSSLVNTNADYWTRLVGIAWDRDVDIDFDREPVDLDGDGKPDTTVTRHIHAKGGILANPELFGLTPTPDDPRGRVGRISVSTGVLGLREPLGPDGKPTGQIGMTCWLCHGEANPVGGAIVLGLPGARFDYGLLLATAAVLDDGNAAAVEDRRARGFPAGAHRARAPPAGGPRPSGSDRRVRARRDRARLSLRALRGDGACAPADARPGQPDQRADDPRRARAGARELVRLRGRGRALARAAGRARRCEPPAAARGGDDAIGGPSGARCSSTCATSGRWACSRTRSPGCSGPTRSTGTRPSHRARSPRSRRCTPRRRCAPCSPRRFERPRGDAGARSRAGARSSPSASSARSPTARS